MLLNNQWSDCVFLTVVMFELENNMSEIKRFNRERRQGLVEMLKGFVSDQVAYSDHFANVWTKVAEETNGYAKRSC
ncbi:hypothetical protein ACP70R_036514 [Stipagrostis hirtigluma subsp. patula]